MTAGVFISGVIKAIRSQFVAGIRTTAAGLTKPSPDRLWCAGVRCPSRPPRRGFLRDERGGLGVFALALLGLMMMLGGTAIDVMRIENNRTILQQTSDRAALAAASVQQSLDAQTVVRDYFAKAGLSDQLVDVGIDEGLNYRSVRVTAKLTQQNFFMKMLGVDTLTIATASLAEERVSNIEIAMVLDVSRSMILYSNSTSGNEEKFDNLKTAAKDFVADILGRGDAETTSITIIPYNGQVNLPAALYAQFNVIHDPGIADVQCLDLPDEVYSTIGISATLALPATGFVDPYSDKSSATPNELNRWCPDKANNKLVLPSNDSTLLQTRIDDLEAIGATSINAGMKWGVTLLDPETRGIFDALIAAGEIGAEFSGRPHDFSNPESIKIIILMTDGTHFEHYRLTDDYRTGPSPIYKDSQTYSIYHESRTASDKYWFPATQTWMSDPGGGSSTSTCAASGSANTGWGQWAQHSDPRKENAYQNGNQNSDCTTATESTAIQQTWQEVWRDLRLNYVANAFYAQAGYPSDFDTQAAKMRTITATTVMDDQLQSICRLAKAQNVLIYGIAFEAPDAAQTQIARCAQSLAETARGDDPESSAYYFESDGSKIGTDFKTISANISQLRLTQ
jgi:Flp pilus assembly protein TadG